MAIDCSDVPTNLAYSCANPWGQDCTSDKHFHFASLWKYTQNIQGACATDTRLFIPNGGSASPQNASLTQASCAAIAGWDWTYYPNADIWTRLTAWKFPLLQLVASCPRPPLSFSVECFVIVHLLGDPVDTITNLLAKMSSCQRIAEDWRAQCEILLEKRDEGDEDGDWKALALVTDAYGEWGEADQAREALHDGLRDNPEHKNDLASAIRQTGRALAADRSTKFLPIIVAQAFFIGAVGIAIFRTASAAGASASSDTVFINVEAHSIAFSALYFWIVPAVFLSSVIGVSQTEAAIPRILSNLQDDVDRLNLPNRVNLPNGCLDNNQRNHQKRIFHGGIYSWRTSNLPPSGSSLTYHDLLPYLVVIMGTATGITVSALVPPDGWDCRHIGEVFIFIAWVLSAQVDVLLNRLWPLSEEKNQSKLFWITGIKDLLITTLTMGCVITVQIGIFNRCSCYTLWGRTGLALPEMPEVSEVLFHRLNTAYPAITFTSISVELIVVPLFICIWYRDALRTFVQRDDGKSNAVWLWKLLKTYRTSKAGLQRILPRWIFGLSKAKRTDTLIVEEGPLGNSYEMQHLTHTYSEEPERISTENGSAAGTPVADGQSEPIDSTSQSSGVDSPSRSGTNTSSRPEPRRRVTEIQTENQPPYSRDST